MLQKYHKNKLYIVGAIALIVVTAVLFFFWQNRSSIGFGYYEPTYLPPGVSITDKRVLKVRSDVLVEQKLSMNNWDYAIDEYPLSQFPKGIGVVKGVYDQTSVKPSCMIATSFTDQQKFRVCHWIDYGKTNVYEVKFIKGSTFIVSRIPIGLHQAISVVELSRFVDSFSHKSTQGIPVLQSEGP